MRTIRLGFLLALLGAWLCATWLAVFGLARHFSLDSGRIGSEKGHAYYADIPRSQWLIPRTDNENSPNVSSLELFEDGVALGPAHTGHADIRASGMGAYSHWGEGVLFSASDNSDPRKNGRSYVVHYRVYLREGTERVVEWGAIVTLIWAATRLFGSIVLTDNPDNQFRRAHIGRIVGLLRSALTAKGIAQVAGWTLIYSMGIVLILAALSAQRQYTGTVKINFEYKVF